MAIMKISTGIELETQYNLCAKEYSVDHRVHNQKSINAYFDIVSTELEQKKILDLGCGSGEDLVIFNKRGAQVSAIDSSMSMVNLAQKLLPMADIRCESFAQCTFAENIFDLVTSKWAIQTAHDIDKVYIEVNRVLKNGGKFIFIVTHPIRHFIEKRSDKADYFKQQIVKSVLFEGLIVVEEPSHTLTDYLSSYFLEKFEVNKICEGVDSGAEKIGTLTYPSYLLIAATKK